MYSKFVKHSCKIIPELFTPIFMISWSVGMLKGAHDVQYANEHRNTNPPNYYGVFRDGFAEGFTKTSGTLILTAGIIVTFPISVPIIAYSYCTE